MTASEYQLMAQRLKELEEKNLLPAETIEELRRWLYKYLPDTHDKIIVLPWVRN